MSLIRIPKTYEAGSVEQPLYDWWEKNGWFKPQNDPNSAGHDPMAKPFVIAMPPPNVTGELHLGHAMFVSVEDMLIRHHRMKGAPTLWVPGSDHAGIATQLQVELDIWRSERLTREEIGREEFLRRTWAWKQRFGNTIYDQLRRLGASCDWGRERFTLDEGLSAAVIEAFVRLYRKGLVYRGLRLINWSPELKTSVSDLEVEYSEEEVTLYFFKYFIKGTATFIPVATTRPETILGDVAVAVHPDDSRYAEFVGKTALVPIVNREISVIADAAVDMEFGTGALKVTPGHDFTDYEVGLRHSLPVISILDREARITSEGGPYEGLDRFEARDKLWADMAVLGLTIKEVPYRAPIPRSQRGGDIVEPMASVQWFVRVKPLADAALAAVTDGRVRIVPSRYEKVYLNWLETIQDWCISRQLWWGHRIPVWYASDGTEFCAHSEEEAHEIAIEQLGSHVDLDQDPDVLDTWFSSALWPFSILGWPSDSADLDYFYPTSLLETGHDILFFWVARMIMFGLEFTGEVPFQTVYLHGMVQDQYGRRMSKTLGNGIDPCWVLDGAAADELPEYARREYPEGLPPLGADALRLALLTSSTPGNDLNLDLRVVEACRNFANKIWNIGRFVIINTPTAFERGEPRPTTLADHWIMGRLQQVIRECTRLIDDYEIGQAGNIIRDFVWGDFADWYIEISKVAFGREDEPSKIRSAGILVHVLDTTLRLLHPYTPYITEKVWQELPRASGDPPALIVAPWPEAVAEDIASMERFEHIRAIVRSVRRARAEIGIQSAKRIPVLIVAGDKADWLGEQRTVLAAMARLDETRLAITRKPDRNTENAVMLTEGSTEIYLLLEDFVEPEAEQERLKKELVELAQQIETRSSLLASDFALRAPTELVEAERRKLDEAKAARLTVMARLGGNADPS